MPVNVWAKRVTGSCGDSASYSFSTKTGTLTISGEGEINSEPWRKKYHNQIKSVVIEDGITAVRTSFFCAGETKLESVSFPDSLRVIDGFSECNRLSEICLPPRLEIISSYAFSACSSLKKIVISYNVARIERNAFSYCPLEEIRFQTDCLVCIGKAAFAEQRSGMQPQNCSVTFPASRYEDYKIMFTEQMNNYGNVIVTFQSEQTEIPTPDYPLEGSCGESSFYTYVPDTGILTISGIGAVTSGPWYTDGYRNHIKEVIVEEGITQIGERIFEYCGMLKKVTLPPGFKKIGKCAFKECVNLEEVNMKSCKIIGEESFLDCHALFHCSLPSGLEKIGEFAFGYCTSLKNLVLPKGLNKIDSGAFVKVGVTNITIPGTVVQMGANLFGVEDDDNESLKSVVFEEGITEIGRESFSDCKRLRTVQFPNSLKVIGVRAFYSADLKKVTIPRNVEKIRGHAFWNGFSSAGVPKVVFESYKKKTKLTAIGNGAFTVGVDLYARFYVPSAHYQKYKKMLDASNTQKKSVKVIKR